MDKKTTYMIAAGVALVGLGFAAWYLVKKRGIRMQQAQTEPVIETETEKEIVATNQEEDVLQEKSSVTGFLQKFKDKLSADF